MVYVGQSHCAPSNASELPEMVEEIKSDLLRLAEESGGRFRALGLALDPSPIEGFHHLTKYGNFDEIRAGGGTLSDSAIEFIWEDFPGVAATPQVLVIGRVRVSPESPDAPVEYMLEREVEIVRLIGLDGIGSWSLDERLPRRVQLFLDQSSDGVGN